MVIAIDGPAGAGKSTVCKNLAERLGLVYLDTGAMYRAVAWAIGKAFDHDSRQLKNSGEHQVPETLGQIPLLFSIEGNHLEIFYREKFLSDELRNPEISEWASKISQISAVREFLVGWQRKLAKQGAGIVAEGRDTATVVFPEADLKVFLTADLETRAKRRLAEYIEKGINVSLEELQARIRDRDEADSKRDHSPLRPAQGAILLDTSHMNVAEVVNTLSKLAQNRIDTGSSVYAEL